MSTTGRDCDPSAQIAADNPWYVDDQEAVQIGSPGRRLMMENRWHLMSGAIERWAKTDGIGGAVRLLDAGTGDGNNLRALRQGALNARLDPALFAIDYNPLRVARAAKRTVSVEALVGSLLETPFPGGFFDVLLCNHVLEHIRDDRAAIRELSRVARPGALLIVGVPNEGCVMARARNHGLQRGVLRTTDHVHFHTRESLTQLVESAAFSVREIHTEGFFLPHTRLTSLFSETVGGRNFLDKLGHWCPSQAAGLFAIAEREPD